MIGESSQPHSERPPADVARECWDIFMFEINGTGIAYQFEHGPRDFDDVVKHVIPRHLNDTGVLQRHIERFDRYKDILKSFAPFPVIQTMPDYSIGSTTDRIVIREIKPELLDLYDTFSETLGYYAEVIDERIAGRTDNDEVIGAAIELCKIARPAMWDPDAEEGSQRYYAGPLRDGNPRWYLEVVLAEAAL